MFNNFTSYSYDNPFDIMRKSISDDGNCVFIYQQFKLYHIETGYLIFWAKEEKVLKYCGT